MTDEARPYFPMFVDISHKKVVVVGAGTIAKRRIRTLVDFTECLTVIAPEVNPELLELQAQGKIRILKKQYQREDIYDADLVIAATNDHQTNEDIYSVCKCMGITVNVCSDKNKCDFYFPAIVEYDGLVIGVTSGGSDHRKVRRFSAWLRQALAKKEDGA